MPTPRPLPRLPSTPAEFAAYYDLRWRVLREPWQQPRGSERDEWDDDAFHLGIFEAGRVWAAGRLHRVDRTTAQIRYMAVHPDKFRLGLGSAILAGLESQARSDGFAQVRLAARDTAVNFYEHHGYAVIGAGPTKWGIPHQCMSKRL